MSPTLTPRDVALERATASANAAGARRESFVVPHDELGLDLIDRIHGHADHDEQGSAAEVKLYVEAFQKEAREIRVDPVADPRQMLQVNAGNHDVRNQA